jgi:serine phosphatase RsbU (regulator of sigma subunit)
MKIKISFIVVIITLLLTSYVNGQSILASEKNTLDSIKSELNKAKNLDEKEKLHELLDKTYENITTRFRYEGDFDNTIFYLEEAMNVALEGKKFKVYATLLNNKGLVLKEIGRHQEALECFYKSLKIKDTVAESIEKGELLNNIGSLYLDDGQIDKAFEYINKATKIREESGDPYIGDAYWNISFMYLKIGDTLNYVKNLQIASERYNLLDNDYGKGSYHFTLGAIMLIEKKYKESEEHFLKVLPYYKRLNFKEFISWAYYGVSKSKKGTKKIKEAILYADSSLQVAQLIDSKERIKYASELLSIIYQELGNYKSALEYYKLFIKTKEIIENESNSKILIRSEFQYQYDKKAATDSIAFAKEKEISELVIQKKEGEILQQQAEIKAKRNQQIALFGGLGLVLLFAGFMYNRFKVTQKQKQIIETQKTEVELQRNIAEEQKHLVEEKNKEITDSINYAKRIQEAILPSRYSLVENLKNGFVLFKPKDVVSGDFYWLEVINSFNSITNENEQTIYFAAADCTGHGVPGAMVSVVCSNALSKALLEEGIIETGKILDRTRELVIQRFAKSGEEVKDGMDISLVSIQKSLNSNSGEKFKTLSWSGANNPLWIIKKEATEVEEIKADKQPIGNYSNPKPFTTHQIDVCEGDSIYIFTDGYQDQFGGEKGKKFKASQLKEVLLSIQYKTMDEQRIIVENVFNNWKKDVEQVDDVCIIGVRL